MNQRKEDRAYPSDAESPLEETEALIWDLLDERLAERVVDVGAPEAGQGRRGLMRSQTICARALIPRTSPPRSARR